MAQELIYTSAERGLRPGTRGFCTVAYTRGMKPQTVQLLEAMSAYKNLYAVHSEGAGNSPVSYSHYRTNLTGRQATILSRVGPALADHTLRSNKVAHHVVISSREQAPGGPAWLALQPGFFVESWAGDPHHIAEPKTLPQGDSQGTFAARWQEIAGDAGWAGHLAHLFLRQPALTVYLVFVPGMPMLELVAEALALLPPTRRWDVTFNTYVNSVPTGAVCAWRCCVPDAEILREARRNPKAMILDLAAAPVLSEANPLVACAREGSELPVEESLPLREAPCGESASGFRALPNRNRSRLRMRPRDV